MLLALTLIGTSVPVTMAYLTDTQEAVNELGFTNNSIRIEEEFEPPENPGPGTEIKKSPKLINESDIPVYVRMSARFTDDQAEQFCLPLEINDGWEQHTDGYYYYHKKLDPGESTTALFNRLEIRKDAEADTLVPFDLLIYAESVQCDDMTEQEAWAFYEKAGL